MKPNPCMLCGACCALYPVCFPENEISEKAGPVPAAMTLSRKGARRIMQGTQTANPRCIALEGTVGTRVRCGIYEARPSVCRCFARAWEAGRGNPLCDRARQVYGMMPFSPY